jgi:hypothetical protein
MLYLTARGVQPVGSGQHIFEWCDIYGAVAPTTGEHFCLELPYLNAETFQPFIGALAQAFPDGLKILLMDNSGAHTARHLSWPENVRGVWVPSSCSELNFTERVWRDLKDQLAWKIVPDLDTLWHAGEDLLQAYDTSTRTSLTSDPDLVETIHALSL